jgi:hypothetical protein
MVNFIETISIGVTVAALALLGGCSTPPHCEELSKCGGDYLEGETDRGEGVLSTKWTAGMPDACIDQVPATPEPPSLAYIPPRPAGIRAVEPSTIDWCAGLVINNMGQITAFDDGWYEALVKYDGWFPGIPLYQGELTLFRNNQYEVKLTQLVSQHIELTQTCLIAQGTNISEDTCDAITAQLATFVPKRLESIDGLEAQVYDARCVKDTQEGCICDYNMSLTSGARGPYAAGNDGRINFFDEDAAPPGRADYCAGGGTLQLTGSTGTDLFNRSGLKTLQFHQAP